MKLKELKIVNPQYLQKSLIDKECEEGIGSFCEHGLKGYSLYFSLVPLFTFIHFLPSILFFLIVCIEP